MCQKRDLIHTQHQHNNHTTTPHMSVGPSVWGPPSCEGLLCWCCKFNIFQLLTPMTGGVPLTGGPRMCAWNIPLVWLGTG
jgi:hypothetical protein